MKINIKDPWMGYHELHPTFMSGCSFCILCKAIVYPGQLYATIHQYHKPDCPFFEEKNEDHSITR